ncbi:CopG family transcriptional regulator [Superficieibacter sp. BNK-5]|uniref:ribbon-helix-helix domain-containing protein n=1 Tax=Superficieibacter sp. BNK-5 TaxID=3376142 RepID=UPI0039BF0CBD
MSTVAGIDMGRILLDLSDDVIKRLDDLKHQRGLPRAELLREAVEEYLERQNQAKAAIANALGLWQGCEEDGVEFERALREEWER